VKVQVLSLGREAGKTFTGWLSCQPEEKVWWKHAWFEFLLMRISQWFESLLDGLMTTELTSFGIWKGHRRLKTTRTQTQDKEVCLEDESRSKFSLHTHLMCFHCIFFSLRWVTIDTCRLLYTLWCTDGFLYGSPFACYNVSDAADMRLSPLWD